MADPNCPECEGDGWVQDPTACGDPEHCSPIMPCRLCNPDGDRPNSWGYYPLVFDPTRHTWMCTPPYDQCPPSCSCHCHRPAPKQADYINGWIPEDEL